MFPLEMIRSNLDIIGTRDEIAPRYRDARKNSALRIDRQRVDGGQDMHLRLVSKRGKKMRPSLDSAELQKRQSKYQSVRIPLQEKRFSERLVEFYRVWGMRRP